jgi:hypothetical protein
MVGRVFRAVRTPIVLVIFLGILVYGAWWGWTNIVKPVKAKPANPCVPTKVTDKKLKTKQVTVQVKNGGDKHGLASHITRELDNAKFHTLQPTNTNKKITKTVIVGHAAKDPEVKLVKKFFKKAKVRSDHRPDRTVDVLVGNGYKGFNKHADRSYPVNTKTVCLPKKSGSATPKSS